MRLRLKLALVFGAFIAIILSAVAVSVYVLTERSLTAGVTDRAESALAEITSGESTIAEALTKLPSNTYYQIYLVGSPERTLTTPADLASGVDYTSNGDLIHALPDGSLQGMLDDGEVAANVTLGGSQVSVLGKLGRIDFPDQRLTFRAVFLVGIPASLMATTLDQLERDLAITVFIAFLVFAVGVWVLAERVLRPLKGVTEASGHVSGSDLSRRVPIPGPRDEIRDLAVSINHMLDRLQESFETQRRFTADASHELRTPVTAIGGHVNYLLRRTNPNAEQLESLETIQRETNRMGKLVSDLLELARADAGFTVELQPMNLVEVAEAAAKDALPVGSSATVKVSSRSPLVEVLGDQERLKQVVLNLVQNAVNAGATRVEVSLVSERNRVRLEVLDDGVGISAEALPHLFERFYRIDGSRSARGSGSGLGLPIVRWLVQQHGGTVEVESKLGEGTVFTVFLPLPRQQELGAPKPALVDGLKNLTSSVAAVTNRSSHDA